VKHIMRLRQRWSARICVYQPYSRRRVARTRRQPSITIARHFQNRTSIRFFPEEENHGLSARDTAAVVGVSAAVGFLGGLLSVPFSFSVLGARLQKRTPITFSTNHAVDTVVARRFVLIDSEGRTRATLENTDEGAELELTSPRTKTVARLDVTDSAPIEALQRLKANRPRQIGPSSLEREVQNCGYTFLAGSN